MQNHTCAFNGTGAVYFSMAAVPAAAMACAAVFAAGTAFAVVMFMMVAFHVGVIVEHSAGKALCRLVRVSLNAAEKPDARLRQRRFCAAADAAADKRVDIQRRKKSRKRAVSAAVGVYYLSAGDFSVLNTVDLEPLGMSEVLEDLSVFIG